jgi:hypothetical protein
MWELANVRPPAPEVEEFQPDRSATWSVSISSEMNHVASPHNITIPAATTGRAR